jgi:hypothetical protein
VATFDRLNPLTNKTVTPATAATVADARAAADARADPMPSKNERQGRSANIFFYHEGSLQGALGVNIVGIYDGSALSTMDQTAPSASIGKGEHVGVAGR